ncbi:MAG: Ig-like domain-containing protein, partial [Treponema sp.]
MKVSVFNKSGVEITGSPFTETDIETAGGTSVTIAKNISGGTEEVNKRYEQIYGSNEGDVPFYLTVELVDSAKTYINPKETENTTVGNSTSSCYINDDVYSTLLSTKLTTSYGISYSDIKNILNGTISADTTVGTIVTFPASTLLKLLNEKVTDTRIKKLAFSLNPDANPRYVVSGYALPQDLSNIETGTRNQTVTVVASAGLDGTSILPETLKVWIKQLNSISDSSLYSEFINNPSESTGGILIADNSSYNSSSRSSYTYSVTLPNSIVTGKYYIIAVTGTDADEEALVADYVYGLLGDVSGSPPKIFVDTPAELSSASDSDALTFTGIASSTTATVSTVTCSVVVIDEAKSSSEAGYSVGTITGNASLDGTAWNFTPSNATGYDSCAATSGSGKRYLYTATFTANDSNGNSSYVTRNIHVDSASPEVTISSVSPVVSRKSDGVKCVNGTITVSGTLPAAEGLYDILLTATDTVGTSTTYNLTSNSLVVAVDSGSPTLKVTSPTDGSYCGNSFTVTGSINDTSVTFNVPVCYVYNYAQNAYAKTDSVTATTPSVTNGVWKSTVTSNASAQYQVVFTAYDKFGQVGSASLNYKIDNVPPTFSVTKLGSDTVALSGAGSATSKYAKKSILYAVNGTVKDTGSSEIGDFVYYNIATSSPAVVGTGSASYYDLSQEGWTKVTITKKSSGNTWSANLDFSADYTEGTAYKIYLATMDNAGNISLISANPSACVSITPDATAPVATSVVSTPSSISAFNSNVDVVITASVTDSLCGISSVSLYENGSSIATMSLMSGANYSCTLSNSNIKTGTHTYIVRATDSVGNTSSDDTYAVTLQVDKTAPNLSGLGVTPSTTSGKMNGVLTISATATDETSLASISWSVCDSVGNDIVTSENYSADSYYKAPTIGASEKLYKSFNFKIDSRKISKGRGDYTLKVYAKDAAGNTSATATYSLPLDQTTDNPVITLDAPADVTVTTEGGITSTKGLFKSTESISGTVTDDDGISEITIALDSEKDVAPTFSRGAKSISFTQALSGLTTGTLTEGAHKISITTKDTEFNTSTSTGTFYIGVDDSAPALDVTTESGFYYNKEFTVEGTATDSYSMAENNPVTFDGAAVTSYTSGTGAWAKKISKPNTSESQTKTITATDKFGRTTSESFKYTFDLDNPTVSISAIDDNGNGNTLTENSVATTYFDKTNRLVVTGAASDSTLNSSCQSGLSSIKCILAGGANASLPADTASWTTLAASSSWTLNTDLSSKEDGAYTLWVKVSDLVGNTSSTSKNLYAIGGAPVLEETTLGSESVYKKGSFSLGGTVTSGTSVLSDMLSLKYTYNENTNDVTGWTSGSGTWSLQGSGYTEKTYSYTITATNKAKLSTTIKRTVVIDKTAPSATISIPLEETYYTSANMTVSGTASDATAGLKSIQIKYDSDADYSDVAVSKNWIANKTFTEGEHTVHLLVTDNAENTSTIDRKFYMDLASPTSTLTYDTSAGSLYNTSTGKEGGAVSSISPDTTYLADASFKISGVITETFMDTATLSVSKNGGTSSTLWTYSDSKTWSYTQSAANADGTYIYTLYVKDKAGQTFTKSVTVIVDTTSPTLDVTSPAGNESVEIATKTAKGTASDDGSGVKAVSYNLYTSDGVTLVKSDSKNVTGNAKLIGESWSVSDMPLGTTEGTLILKVTATDKLSHSAEKTITFYYDKAAPTLTETTVGVSGLTTNKAVTLSGKIWDTNEISSVAISDGTTTWSSKTGTGSDDSTLGVTTFTKATSEPSSSNWSKTFAVGNGNSTKKNYLADGTHVLTIVATDAAGKTTALTRTVVIDTSIPSVNKKTITTSKSTIGEATWYSTTQLAVEVATTDNGTGVSSVEYSTDYDTSNDTGNWNSLTKSSAVWKGTVSCTAKTENVYYIYFKATDVAGNTNKYATCYLQPNIDTGTPTASLHSVDTDTSFSGTKLVNGTKTVKVEISASD